MKVPEELLAKLLLAFTPPANDQVFGRFFTNRVTVIAEPIRLERLRLNRQYRSIYKKLFLEGRV
jgi:hypothetical protein